jgi:hypothetical protein
MRIFIGLLTVLILAACGGDNGGLSPDSGLSDDADLGPDATPACPLIDGVEPPKITQLIVRERILVSGTQRIVPQLAFGEDLAVPASYDDRQVVTAVPINNEIWLVFDTPLDAERVEINGGPALRQNGLNVVCDGIASNIDFIQSRYHPSAGQIIPAKNPQIIGDVVEDIATLGPALQLRVTELRTGADCAIIFNDVANEQGACACAPEGGDPTLDCTPGDTAAVSFRTEQLLLEGSSPTNSTTMFAVDRVLLAQFNAGIAQDSLTAITLSEGANANSVPLTAMVSLDDWVLVELTPLNSLLSATTYTLRLVGLRDRLGGPLPQEETVTFTTAP